MSAALRYARRLLGKLKAAAAAAGASYLIDRALINATGISELNHNGSYAYSASGATNSAGNNTILSDGTIDDSTYTDFTVSVVIVAASLTANQSIQVWAMADDDTPYYGSPYDGFVVDWKQDGYIRLYKRTTGANTGGGTAYNAGQPQAGDVLGIRMIYNSGKSEWQAQAYLNDSAVITDYGTQPKPAGAGQSIAVTKWQGSGECTFANLRAADNA